MPPSRKKEFKHMFGSTLGFSTTPSVKLKHLVKLKKNGNYEVTLHYESLQM